MEEVLLHNRKVKSGRNHQVLGTRMSTLYHYHGILWGLIGTLIVKNDFIEMF